MDEFHRRADTRSGRRSRCKGCLNPANAARMMERYNSDVEFRASALAASKARNRARYAADAEYRAKVHTQAAEWAAAHPDESRDTWYSSLHYRRAVKAGAPVAERLRYSEVIRRGNGICGICGAAIAPGEETLDHIIPLSRGGSHTYENCQVAHLACNSSKGVKILEEEVA